MEKFTLNQLYTIYEKMIIENQHNSDIDVISQMIKEKENQLFEDSATGGPAGAVGSSSVGFGGNSVGGVTTAGMGSVISSQPSAFPGSLNGVDWINGGGSSGSGDISVPYNPSGKNRVFQKIQSPMGKNHGSKTGKKSRTKKLDLKALKDIFSKKQDYTMTQGEKPKKVMNFDDFSKKELSQITKIKEGRAFKSAKNPHSQSLGLKSTINSHIKSLGGKVKHIGDDFEITLDSKSIAQVIFRPNFIGVKKTDDKFVTEFKYTELGKIKSKISDILKLKD